MPADVCGRLVDCYGDDLVQHVPLRAPLAVDDLGAGPGSRCERQMLTGYVQLVRRLRAAEPGDPIPLRAADIGALAGALDNDPETVEQSIIELLGCSPAEARTLHRELLRRKLVVSGAGLAASIAVLAGVHAAAASSNPSHAPGGTGIADAPTTALAVVSQHTVVVPSRRHRATTTTTAASARNAPAEQREAPTTPVHAAATHQPEAPAGGEGGWRPLPDPPNDMPRPSIPYDDTPVGVLPGETPITNIGTAISTVAGDD